MGRSGRFSKTFIELGYSLTGNGPKKDLCMLMWHGAKQQPNDKNGGYLMIGNIAKSLKKINVFALTFAVLFIMQGMVQAQIGKTAASDPAKQKEVNDYGANIDQTIILQYQYLEAYGKNLIDDDVQSVPQQVTIIQPKRPWEKKGNDFETDKFKTDTGKVRFKDQNTIEIIQHGFIYDEEYVSSEPVGRKYKTITLKFKGDKANRSLEKVIVEIYAKNYRKRTYYSFRLEDKSPITKIDQNYKPDGQGHTSLDKSISVFRRSNMDDAEQIAKEESLADQSSKQKPYVTKDLKDIKNTPAQPLRNEFKNKFYRVHLNHFSNIVFHIYEMHKMRYKDSDNYMLDFLKESTTY